MNEKDIYIVGAGTYGEVMFELAKLLGYSVKGYYDEDDNKKNKVINGVKVLGKFSGLESSDIKGKQFIIAIGNNSVRYQIFEKINYLSGYTPTLIHPDAKLSPSIEVGKGVYIHANSYIWTKVRIDHATIVSPNVVIAHHSNIGKACLISTLSSVGASINIEDNVFVGMGSTIVTGISRIGKNTIIGAGAVLLQDAEKDSTYVGIPAKKVK
ncbi:MAG TPA: NeuD/PglB/VioB family sugar acetyltransferase [Ureibacillus sp.]|nr:NeuD/PglB/VioB family sugar acetyltransferase [Ureibacillus sp.]